MQTGNGRNERMRDEASVGVSGWSADTEDDAQ